MVLIQYAFVAVLVGVLVVASILFVVMGLAKVRRSRRLARDAHERGMKFFPDDPYDVPRRYADFAAISSGHSPCANNVTAGQFGGRSIRMFDFRCELGHGTRRLTRQYSVVIAETQQAHPGLLMWHAGDGELAPLAARDAQGQVGPWSYQGPRELAEAIAAACEPIDAAQPGIEIRGSIVLVATAVRRRVRQYGLSLGDAARVLEAVEAFRADRAKLA